MEKFIEALKFALNIYLIAAFITIGVLGVIKIIKRFTNKEKKE